MVSPSQVLRNYRVKFYNHNQERIQKLNEAGSGLNIHVIWNTKFNNSHTSEDFQTSFFEEKHNFEVVKDLFEYKLFLSHHAYLDDNVKSVVFHLDPTLDYLNRLDFSQKKRD